LIFKTSYSCQKELSCEDCIATGAQLPPVAIAGVDKSIILPVDSIFLYGAASYDPDGYIRLWKWTKISGPDPIYISNTDSANTTVDNLHAGIYLFELKVTDGSGLVAKDTLQVIVDDPAINQPPVVWAGNDTTIILPANTIILNGVFTDPENNIAAISWAKLAGPGTNSINAPNINPTTANNLVAGVYVFEFKVIDAGGLFAMDTMQATVITPPPPCTDCKIVFVSERHGNPEIYKCNGDGSNIIRLTNNTVSDEHPVWSPDRTQIAFVSDRSGHSEIYVMQADGSNVVQKTFLNRYSETPSWSPDGSQIAFGSLQNGSMNIWVLNVATGSTSLIFETPGWESQTSWSPDGMKIAIVSDWAAYDFVYDLYYISIPAYNPVSITADIIDTLDYFNPSWAPDGLKLAFAINKNIGANSVITQVGTMNFWSNSPVVIASGAFPSTKTSWSPDGNKILFTSLPAPGAPPNISYTSADGTSMGIIVTNGWNADW
jgi:Tol biopolymer transport system component